MVRNFWAHSKEKNELWVSISKNHHLGTFTSIAIDLSVVWPPRLFLQNTFVPKNISDTNNEPPRCVENFLRDLDRYQVVFKNSLFELILRKVCILSINFKKSPSGHVCEHSDRSKRRMTTPFVSANYICSTEQLRHKQWASTMRRKIFESPRPPPGRFQKLIPQIENSYFSLEWAQKKKSFWKRLGGGRGLSKIFLRIVDANCLCLSCSVEQM